MKAKDHPAYLHHFTTHAVELARKQELAKKGKKIATAMLDADKKAGR